ncbi:MAG: imidazole glycerol phosphate synthase cyclase subunit, partial [Bacteroidia bacterium]|nr:imidazole glycerol phosphate synthase cyclase subunit [Bacteroidia bacterium]
MLKRRIVVCLDVMNNRVVKGVNFEGLKDLGVPAEMAEHYAKRGADELVFLDISATLENRHTRFSWIKEVAEVLDIPFTVGGGIASVQDAEALLMYGADKISVNSAALQNPELIRMLSSKLGSQSVVVAVDTLKEINDYMVYSHGGKKPTGKSLEYWLKEAQELGAGEFLITAIHADGTNLGFDIDLYQKCTSWCLSLIHI